MLGNSFGRIILLSLQKMRKAWRGVASLVQFNLECLLTALGSLQHLLWGEELPQTLQQHSL